MTFQYGIAFAHLLNDKVEKLSQKRRKRFPIKNANCFLSKMDQIFNCICICYRHIIHYVWHTTHNAHNTHFYFVRGTNASDINDTSEKTKF